MDSSDRELMVCAQCGGANVIRPRSEVTGSPEYTCRRCGSEDLQEFETPI